MFESYQLHLLDVLRNVESTNVTKHTRNYQIHSIQKCESETTSVCDNSNAMLKVQTKRTEYGVRSSISARSLKLSNVAPGSPWMGDCLGLQGAVYTIVGLREPRKSDGSSD